MNIFISHDHRLRVGWRFLLSVLFCIAAYMAAIDLSVRLSGGHARLQDALFRLLALVFLVAGYSLLLVVGDHVSENPLTAMGLTRYRVLSQTLYGSGLGIAMVLLAYSLMSIFLQVGFRVRFTQRNLEITFFEFVVLLIAAMAEEVAFRGYPFQKLVEGLGPVLATAVFALLFGMVHLVNPHASFLGFVNTVAISVVLALAYLKTKALWLPWGIHFGWNFALGMLLGMPVSGIQNFSVLVRGSIRGPNWLTGGDYGLEGGAMGTLVILLGLVYLAWVTRSKLGQLMKPMSPDGGEGHLPADLSQSI